MWVASIDGKSSISCPYPNDEEIQSQSPSDVQGVSSGEVVSHFDENEGGKLEIRRNINIRK